MEKGCLEGEYEMSIVWTASIETYRRVIAEKKHMRDELESELALWDKLSHQGRPIPPSKTWYINNELLDLNRQIEDLEEWLSKLEEKREGT